MKTDYLYFILLVVLINNILPLNAQGSYDILFTGPEDTRMYHLFKDNDDKFIAVYADFLEQNKKIRATRVYSFSNASLSDTVQWELNLQRQDTALAIHNITLCANGEYFVVVVGVYYDSDYEIMSRFDWAMKLDNMHNLLWGEKYQWPDSGNNYLSSGWIRMLQIENGDYLLARTLTDYVPQTSTVMNLLHINQYGDSIGSKLYEPYISGYIQDISYNYDSSEYLLHIGEGGVSECSGGSGAFFLDKENLDITGSICYKISGYDIERINLPFSVKWTSNRKLIISGSGSISPSRYLASWIYDTNYQVINTSYLTHPDTLVMGAWSKSLDIYDNGEICVAGSFFNGLGLFTSQYGWAYIAKLDEDLNLLQQRYFGGDASYDVFSIIATSDGGTAISGFRYDYLTNNPEEGDAYVIKTDVGLWVSTSSNHEIPFHSAIVYPNPSSYNLLLRTALNDAEFRLYNLVGQLLIFEPVNKLITEYNVTDLPLGIYVWTITQNNKITDRGQWIKK